MAESLHAFRGFMPMPVQTIVCPKVARGGWMAEGHLCHKVLTECPKITGFLGHQDSRTSKHHPPGTDRPRLPGAQGSPDWARTSFASLPKHFKSSVQGCSGEVRMRMITRAGAQDCHSWSVSPDQSWVVIRSMRVPLPIGANPSWVWPSRVLPQVHMQFLGTLRQARSRPQVWSDF